MEQHPIPRNITGFEFKLIGFMTLKQFLYLVIFMPLAYVIYLLFPIPILNALVGISIVIFGVALAFVPINDRPLDVWIKNFWRSINSPTQYFYRKNNPPITMFQNLYFVADPHRVFAHVESAQMLSKYLASTRQVMQNNARKAAVQQAVQSPTSLLRVKAPAVTAQTVMTPQSVPQAQAAPVQQPIPVASPPPAPLVSAEKKPFFLGEVKNIKRIALSGILIYVKDSKGTPVRLLKTNPHGIFATYNPLPPGEYTFEMKDSNNTYFFDTMKIQIAQSNSNIIEITSKEML